MTMRAALEAAEYWLAAEVEQPGVAKPDEILRVIRKALSTPPASGAEAGGWRDAGLGIYHSGDYSICQTGPRVTWCWQHDGEWNEAADLEAAKAAVAAHQSALDKPASEPAGGGVREALRGWIEHIRADVKAGLTPYDNSFDEALRLVDGLSTKDLPPYRPEQRIRFKIDGKLGTVKQCWLAVGGYRVLAQVDGEHHRPNNGMRDFPADGVEPASSSPAEAEALPAGVEAER